MGKQERNQPRVRVVDYALPTVVLPTVCWCANGEHSE
ncbi:hypothetical protein BH09ACT4_BH09ACT4_07920 [soil metagenome]